MRALIIPLAVVAALLLGGSLSPTLAAGKAVGHDTGTESTQGKSGKTNTSANPDNEGQTETTYSGPKGQIDKDNFTCNNCIVIESSGPGKAN
jgi:hypothetical protein